MVEKRYHHGALRKALLDEGLKRLQSDREADLSLRELARACNVSANAPYRHFKSRDALIAALGAYGFEQLSTKLADIQEEGPNKQFREVGQVFCQFAKDNGALFRLMFGFRFDVADSEPALHQSRQKCFLQVAESVRIIMGEVLIDEKVKQKTTAAWSTLYGFGLLAIDDTFPISAISDPIEGKDVARILARGLRD